MFNIRAPSTITHDSASRAVIVELSGMVPVRARESALSRARCVPSVIRAAVSISPEITDSRSIPSDGARPSLRSRPCKRGGRTLAGQTSVAKRDLRHPRPSLMLSILHLPRDDCHKAKTLLAATCTKNPSGASSIAILADLSPRVIRVSRVV